MINFSVRKCDGMKRLRPARISEAVILTELAVESEAYWGEDKAFLSCFRDQYAVTKDFIEKNRVFILEAEYRIVGFYGIIPQGESAVLQYFYIRRSMIGHGYGKVLWIHMVSQCQLLGVDRIEFVTSPGAAPFYKKMGAKEVAIVASNLRKGRMIPKFIYEIE